MIRNLIIALMVILMVASCSQGNFAWKETPSADKKEAGRWNEEFDPLTLGDDDIVVPTAPSEQTEALSQPVQNPAETVPSTDELGEREMVPGFRVQLLATQNETNARDERRSAIFKFQESVYLEFESSLFKLRVGDCKTRKEAEELRQKALGLGFRDPWIVRTQVYQSANTSSN